MIDLGFLILRDIPKELVQLDLLYFPIQGGFRGFSDVPIGPHYVSVKTYNGEMHKGFWCWVKPGETVVKVYDYEKNIFKDDEPENEAHFKELAKSGAMNRVLIPYTLNNLKDVSLWSQLTTHIREENFPPMLHQEEPMTLPIDINPDDISDWYLNEFKSRFEQAFTDTHGNNIQVFMEEFEYSFLKYISRQSDEDALSRWVHLIQAIYNAGERSVEVAPDLFIDFVYVVKNQFDFLKNEDLQPETVFIAGVNKIIEDMRDVGTKELKETAKTFETYLNNRGITV